MKMKLLSKKKERESRMGGRCTTIHCDDHPLEQTIHQADAHLSFSSTCVCVVLLSLVAIEACLY